MSDVVIVGGGPAGAVTGLLLARRGWDVRLLDRAAFPRAKPCGDCLSADAGRVLHRLGLLPAVLALAPAHLQGWRIAADGGAEFSGRFDRYAGGDDRIRRALSIERRRLDATLLAAAAAAGVTVETGVRVVDVLRETGGRVAGVLTLEPDGRPGRRPARWVVGADGLRSVVSRRLGLVARQPRRVKLSLTAHVHGVADLGPTGEMHLGRDCCVGLAPVDAAGETANLTLVVAARRFRADAGGDASAFFWRTVLERPGLAGRLEHARCTATGGGPAGGPTTLLGSGPFDWPTRRVTVPGAALVGDAAGYYDPFTGQGIDHALRGAERLASALDRALRHAAETRRVLRGYAVAHRRMMTPALALQHVIELVLSRPRLRDAALRRLAGAPVTADALVAAAGDLLTPAALLSFRHAANFLSPPRTPA